MSLLSDLNDKIKALSTRVGTEVQSLWGGVNTAQSTATAAQTTANTAKSTADTANSTANTALSTANEKVSKSGDTMTGNLSFGVDKTVGASWGINGGTATLRAAGSVGAQSISLVWTDSAGTTNFYSILDANGNFLPTKTYSAGTGLSLSGTQFSLATSGVTAGTVGGTTSATLSHGGTFTTPYITFDAYGRATGYGYRTLTLPADNNTDTKVTNTASNTTKFYITGTSSSSTNTGTQYFDTGVYVTDTAGYLHCTRLEVGSGTIWVA